MGFFVDDNFAGWGGLRPEGGDADLALVLHPDYWVTGRAICEEIVACAFGEMGFDSVTVLLPPTRSASFLPAPCGALPGS